MNQLPPEKRIQILRLLVEGNSLRAISRIVDCSINTVTKLLASVGDACVNYHDKTVRHLSCKRIQADEIWSFVYSKQKNVPQEKQDTFGVGDVWTWTALCPDTKLIVSWRVGDRSQETADLFMADLASRLLYKVHLSTDGYCAYPGAVEKAFGSHVHYGAVIKVLESTTDDPMPIRKEVLMGHPDRQHISTSIVERQNLTMRMSMKRFARRTNGFSKKIENHVRAVALHFMHYNFVRIHNTIRVTPAMEAGVTNRLWSLEDLLKLTGGSK